MSLAHSKIKRKEQARGIVCLKHSMHAKKFIKIKIELSLRDADLWVIVNVFWLK